MTDRTKPRGYVERKKERERERRFNDAVREAIRKKENRENR